MRVVYVKQRVTCKTKLSLLVPLKNKIVRPGMKQPVTCETKLSLLAPHQNKIVYRPGKKSGTV